MMRKRCPACGKYSYSADKTGTWICPTCGKILTGEQMLTPGFSEDYKDYTYE